MILYKRDKQESVGIVTASNRMQMGSYHVGDAKRFFLIYSGWACERFPFTEISFQQCGAWCIVNRLNQRKTDNTVTSCRELMSPSTSPPVNHPCDMSDANSINSVFYQAHQVLYSQKIQEWGILDSQERSTYSIIIQIFFIRVLMPWNWCQSFHHHTHVTLNFEKWNYFLRAYVKMNSALGTFMV